MRALWILIMTFTFPVLAQQVEVKDDPQATQKASEYFQDRKKENPSYRRPSDSPSAEGAPRFLAVHIGTFFSDQGYRWGDGDQDSIGKLNAGVTYRMGEWVNSMDFSMRIDYTTFSLDEGNARKLSLSGLITFPDANSRFPLYFGGGLGPGFFLKQLEDESAIAIDYSVFAGVRFMNVIETMGFMFETGLKNHIHLLSDGQFNGVYVNVGTVFAF